MGRVLVTEKLAPAGLELMAEAGHQVDVQLDLSPEELIAAVAGAQALVIRSATTVTAEVLLAGNELVVVGRAGIGLDNVDVAAATQREALPAGRSAGPHTDLPEQRGTPPRQRGWGSGRREVRR